MNIDGNLTVLNGKANEEEDFDFESIKLSYVDCHEANRDTTFDGFNELYVLTFSYSVPFISKLMRKFDYAEVIFGCEGIVKNDANSLLAYQMQLQGSSIDNVKSDKYLRSRIEDESAHFYVFSRLAGVSHQKIYLLKAADGRSRVVFGSPNAGERAWDGSVLEFVAYCDDRSLYEHLKIKYDLMRDESTDEILKKGEIIKPDETSVEELPICKKIKTEKTILVQKAEDELAGKIDYAIKVDEKWEKISKELVKSVKIKDSEDGYSYVTSDHLDLMISKRDAKKHVEKYRKDPQFVIDYVEESVSFNGISYDLNPKKDEVSVSISKLKDYMDGFCDKEHIIGDYRTLTENMYKIVNYMLLSPFMGKLVMAGLDKDFQNHSLPLYMLVQGQSDCGKSRLVEFIHKAMFGVKIKRLGKSAMSTSTTNSVPTVPKLITNVKGVPLYIDEMDGINWKYAGGIFKDDDVLMELGQYDNRPCFIINTNCYELKVPKDYTKRIVSIYIDENTRFLEDFAAKNKLVIKKKIEEMDTAMYREYLRRMFPSVNELVEMLQRPISAFDDLSWVPDIFKISSNVLADMFMEYLGELPEGFRVLTWQDYMGVETRASKAIDLMIKDYMVMPEIFSIKKDKLYINYTNRTKNIDKIKEELPVEMEARIVNNMLILDLQAARKFTGLKFRKNIFGIRS